MSWPVACWPAWRGRASSATRSSLRVRCASLALLTGALSAFLVFGIAIWSQLTIGWQWSAPSSPATRAAMLLMSGAVGACVVLAILAALPLVWTIVTSARRSAGRTPLTALGATAVGVALLIIGSVHFGHGWPGTGGHAWSGRDVVPGAVARFCWAATLWMTSYWAHPGRLAAFPASELVWMVVSPMALLAALIGSARVLRTLPISARTLRYELRLGGAAALAMAVLLGGASSWIVSGGPSPRGLFRVGAIDAVAITAMSAALMLGLQALRRGLATRPDERMPT